MSLFIHAPNVHQGGGGVLLFELLKILPKFRAVFVVLDERMLVPDGLPINATMKRVKPCIFNRLKAEVWLFLKVKKDDAVLCFGNLPPLFKLKGHVSVFLQNRYLIDKVSFDFFPLVVKIRISLERFWLLVRKNNANEFIVQTSSMHFLCHHMLRDIPVKIMPFMGGEGKKYIRNTEPLNKNKISNRYDFLYVASGDSHKNHRKLVEAWVFLAQENIRPSLCLTIDKSKFSGLCAWIEQEVERFQLRIVNLGVVSSDQIDQCYRFSSALIYPSFLESFGLPLLEANQLGLPILASELDYVRDVCVPSQTFDANSARSIARAVKRFLNISEAPIKIFSVKEFLSGLEQ